MRSRGKDAAAGGNQTPRPIGKRPDGRAAQRKGSTMKGFNQNGAPAVDADGNVIVSQADKRRLEAEDAGTEALYALALLGDLVDTTRDGELYLTEEGTQGLACMLARAQGAVRKLLDMLTAEREEAKARRAEGEAIVFEVRTPDGGVGVCMAGGDLWMGYDRDDVARALAALVDDDGMLA